MNLRDSDIMQIKQLLLNLCEITKNDSLRDIWKILAQQLKNHEEVARQYAALSDIQQRGKIELNIVNNTLNYLEEEFMKRIHA